MKNEIDDSNCRNCGSNCPGERCTYCGTARQQVSPVNPTKRHTPPAADRGQWVVASISAPDVIEVNAFDSKSGEITTCVKRAGKCEIGVMYTASDGREFPGSVAMCFTPADVGQVTTFQCLTI